MFFIHIFCFCSLVSVLCIFCGFEIFKIILITSFILLLVIVIDTHFAPLKDLSKAFACMTNGNSRYTSLILKKIEGFRKHLRTLKNT